MKKLLSTLALAALVVLPAEAQYNRWVGTTVIAGGTNNVINLATNTYSLPIDVSEFAQASVQITGMLVSSNFCKPRLDFMYTADSSAGWTSTNLIQVACLGGLSSNNLSSATFGYHTNINVEGIHSLKLIAVANADYHGIMSNVVVTVGGKKLFVR